MKNIIQISRCDGNTTPVLQEALARIQPDAENILSFESGTYRFWRDGTNRYQIFASSTVPREVNVLFPFLNVTNVTLEGNGSEFIFCDRMEPFFIQNCQSITLKNFQMDYSFLRYAYGTVTTITEEGFSVHLDENLFHYTVDNGYLNFIAGADILSTRHRKISMKRIEPTVSRTYFLYCGNTDIPRNAAARSVESNAEQIQGGVFFHYRGETEHPEFNEGDVICLAYDNEREAQAFYAEDSRDIRLENISIYRNAGMGFVADVCENIFIDGLRIQVKPNRNEYYSSTADGIFLTNCSGNFVLQNSIIQNTYDDAINVHGYYSKIEHLLSDTRAELGFGHPAHWGLIPCRVGDVLLVNDPHTLAVLGEAKVLEVSYDEERRNIRVTFERGAPLVEGALLENMNRMPTVTIENNTIKHCPHMRLSSQEMCIQNNDLDNVEIYIFDLIDFWHESGAVSSVQICNNRFGKRTRNGHNIKVGSCRPEGSERIHDSIVIEHNTFEETQENAMDISAVKNLRIAHNRFNIKL